MAVKTIRQKSVFEALKKNGELGYSPHFKIKSLPTAFNKQFMCGISIPRTLGGHSERLEFRRLLKAAIEEILSVYPELNRGVYEITPTTLTIDYDKICYELELFLKELILDKALV